MGHGDSLKILTSAAIGRVRMLAPEQSLRAVRAQERWPRAAQESLVALEQHSVAHPLPDAVWPAREPGPTFRDAAVEQTEPAARAFPPARHRR
jgi:hypothetical protein